jgi:hypothetical protein
MEERIEEKIDEVENCTCQVTDVLFARLVHRPKRRGLLHAFGEVAELVD